MIIFKPRMDPLYSEIKKLTKFISTHNCSCKVAYPPKKEFGDLIPGHFSINNLAFNIYLDDEYNDLALNNPLLNVELALRTLAQIQDTADYLQWCDQLSLDASRINLLDYYKEATHFCAQLSILFKDSKIDSFITDLDFQLNAGAAQYLRNNTIN